MPPKTIQKRLFLTILSPSKMNGIFERMRSKEQIAASRRVHSLKTFLRILYRAPIIPASAKGIIKVYLLGLEDCFISLLWWRSWKPRREVPEAFQYLIEGHTQGKVVITVQNDKEIGQSAIPTAIPLAIPVADELGR